MYFVSGSQGQGTSACPGSSGAPTEWRQGTKSPVARIASRARAPMRVMIRMLTTTYAESVIWTPRRLIFDPIGPMENGITYRVRPRIEPRKRSVRIAFISSGSRQLFVGPASAASREQM